MAGSKRTRGGFTLIELLTVIAVIGLLAAIMVPRWWFAHDKAAENGCVQNLVHLSTCLQVYANDNTQMYPSTLTLLVPNWIGSLPTCPYIGLNTYSPGYLYSNTDPVTYTIWCNGNNHKTIGLTTNQPYYIFGQGLGP